MAAVPGDWLKAASYIFFSHIFNVSNYGRSRLLSSVGADGTLLRLSRACGCRYQDSPGRLETDGRSDGVGRPDWWKMGEPILGDYLNNTVKV
jgi:hypothetical protein